MKALFQKSILTSTLAIFAWINVASAQNQFISIWKTDNQGATTSANNKVQIPLLGGMGDYHIYWEEVSNPSNNDTLVESAQSITITFPSPGVYRIAIKPVNMSIIGIGFMGGNMDHLKLMEVEQWGDAQMGIDDI
jgi:hypothetical protein